MVRQKRRYTKGPGNANGQGRNQQILREIQIKNSNTPKPVSCGNVQNHKHAQKTEMEAPSRPHKGHNLANTRMVPLLGVAILDVNITVKKFHQMSKLD